VTISLKCPFFTFFTLFVIFVLFSFLTLFLILPTVVGDVVGLVVDVDGLVVRSLGCRPIGCSHLSRHTGIKGGFWEPPPNVLLLWRKTSNQEVLVLRSSPTWVKGLRLKEVATGSAAPGS
jgi:hypothetical protein